MKPETRMVVLGISGAGKSSLAQALCAASGATHVELDSLFWGPDWTPRPEAEFRQSIAQAVAGPSWVVDGNYAIVRDIVWPRADTVIWLNYPLWRVLWRVFARTVRRIVTGQVLWQGNRESIRRSFFSRESILLWVLTAYHRRQRELGQLRRTGAFPHLAWIEVRDPAEARAIVTSFSSRCP